VSDTAPRLSLGTAQWGTRYGITNAKGELSDTDVADIVAAARARGVRDADTHRTTNPQHGYGRAQSRLRPWAGEFAVTTKVFGGAAADLPVGEQLAESLSDLGVAQVHACLVHDWYDLSNDEANAVANGLREAKQSGMVARIGISAYESRDVERACEIFGANLGAVQVPTSVLDQRLVGSGAVDLLRSMGTEIQVRSIFLQGLLLDPTSTAQLAQHPDVQGFHRRCTERGVTPLDASLSFVRSLDWVDVVVVGVTSAAELTQIADSWAAPTVGDDRQACGSGDFELLDPRRWSRVT
jgi:aryl-alcohol dehydrogenase-like predicted oxidoreductase